ncbi:MAG TPA: hypothetical protein EYN66_09300 [Myxococcales bacterium]|nr:hypothetical protein [Myxococcales bacterium]
MGKGILWISIGIVMVVFDIVVTPMFSIPITADFSFPIATLAVLYGVLAIISARIAVDHAQLTEEEISEWGEGLEKATPQIISLSEEQWSSEAIAQEVEKSTQIPEVVLIKYMYAIRGYLKDVAADGSAQDRRTL